MDKKDIKALIHLLDDPDKEISNVVTGNLRELGTDVIPELESAWEKSIDQRQQELIENIIQDIQFRNVKRNLIRWKESGATDLMEGVCWIARYQYPHLETEKVRQEIDRISGDIWLELNHKLTALEKVRIMNQIIYDIHKFSREVQNVYAPRNSYINLVLESKKGNPVSLAIIYLLVAKSLGIPILGVSLPKIFILAYMDEKITSRKRTSAHEVLFYINPFSRGAVLGRKEIDHYLASQKFETQDSFYEPCANEEIIRRLVLNLIVSYEKLGFPEKIRDLQELLKILKPEHH
jgi:regulator of sirC expression with transglutaminase-like and TPR domain